MRNSTDTALHYVITHIKEAVKNMQVTLGAFLHIERVFDSTSFENIKSARRHGLRDMICQWVSSILGKRKIRGTLAGGNLEGLWSGAIYRGILSPLLWSLIVYKFITRLKGSGWGMQMTLLS
jgi:hypothetical protein